MIRELWRFSSPLAPRLQRRCRAAAGPASALLQPCLGLASGCPLP